MAAEVVFASAKIGDHAAPDFLLLIVATDVKLPV